MSLFLVIVFFIAAIFIVVGAVAMDKEDRIEAGEWYSYILGIGMVPYVIIFADFMKAMATGEDMAISS